MNPEKFKGNTEDVFIYVMSTYITPLKFKIAHEK